MLIADRFLAFSGRTIDLASGERVLFRRSPAISQTQQIAWSERCAALGNPLWRCAGEAEDSHDRGAQLVDYGLLEDGQRFEAFRPPRRPGDARPPRPTFRGLAERSAARNEGLNAELEQLVRQASDAFETACLGEPRCVRLATSDRLPPRTLLHVLARQGRLNGFVPICVDLLLDSERSNRPLARHLFEILETRHVLLLARGLVTCDRRGWCARGGRPVAACPVGVARVMLTSGVKSARPNVLLLVSRGASTSRPAFAACQASMISPARHDERRRVAIAGAHAAWQGRANAPMAAEAHEPYALAASADFVRMRARAVFAIAQTENGRPGRAEQTLREAMGALARRNDASGAACVALNLGCLLLDRGRAQEAARVFETARQHFDRMNDLRGAVRAAVYLGLAWTDDGRLSEAEAAFRTAHIAQQQAGLNDLQPVVALPLARCLYWQGRFDEATVLTSSLADTDAGAEAACASIARRDHDHPQRGIAGQATLAREAGAAEGWSHRDTPVLAFQRRSVIVPEGDRRVRLSALASRIALARGDLQNAAAQASRALEAAGRTGEAVDACLARGAQACVYGALNDIDAVVEQAREGLAAARRAHSPLRALRIRLIACDNLGRAGRDREAARLVERFGRLDLARLPGLLRTRVEIVLGRGRPTDAQTVVAACPWRDRPRRFDVTQDVVGVLQTCHDVEDEGTALSHVCDAVRDRTRAAAVAIIGANGGAPGVLGRSGPSPGRSTVADRVLETGFAVAVGPTGLGLEAASPVRYAGALIGAVVCRWPADALLDANRVACLLSAAAAATAPHVRSLLDARRAPPGGESDEGDLVGVSEAMNALRKAVAQAAAAPFPVLIEGESGCGKELVARAIHRQGARRLRRFCALNCAALTDELVEAELFGHARGAFTGAVAERVGLFQEADGGTLFLDEVADLSPRAQAKLLRALQDGEVRRIGENVARHVDTRVIAATNRRLDAAAGAGSFRRDLFYRLNVVHIDVPALRDRPDDISVLAALFWQRAIVRIGSRATLAPATLAALARYDWPGNVRELQNVMASLAVAAPRRGSVGPRCLPAAIARAEAGGATLEQARRLFERRFVRAALARAAGHRGRAANSLGISRQGLAKLMVRLKLSESGEIME